MFRLSCIIFLTLPFLLKGQTIEEKAFHVKKITTPITIDGNLEEDVWSTISGADSFWQYFPVDTIISSLPSIIKMCYDDQNLYLGIYCQSIGDDYVIPSLKRDFRAGGNDNITLIFDPFNDGANAFFFGTNPYGVKREGLISGGGEGLDGFSTSWDNVWECQTTRDDDSWTAEIAIPFTSLRFNAGTTKWRFNSYRFDMQANERSTWMHIPRNQIIFSLGFMGDMIWDEPLEAAGSNVTLIPYISGGVAKDFEAGDPLDKNFNLGGDAKVAINSGLSLDLTVNPDFSQVEVDRQITDLSRFEIFFPERRQFFLENADIFGSNGFSNINPFFSRRIGVARDTITNTTVQNTIYGGARLSGKLNANWRIGLMNMQTASDESRGIPASNFAVASLQRKIGSRSFVSIVGVNRFLTTTIENTTLNDRNSVFGVDYNLATDNNTWQGKTFIHKSFTPNISKKDFAHGLEIELNKRRFELGWTHEYVGKNYNAEVGFVRRKNYYYIAPEIQLNFFPNGKIINSHGPSFEIEQFYQPGLGLTDQELSLSYRFQSGNNSDLYLEVERNYVYLFNSFDPTGTGSTKLSEGSEYTYTAFISRLSTDQSRMVSGRLSPYIGQYYDGNRFGMSGSFKVRLQPYANIEMNFGYNRFDMNYLDEIKTTYLFGPRIDLTFSKSLFLTTFVQYNSQSENTNINARFQWRFAPVSDFFLVWADNYFTGYDPSDRFAVDVRSRSIVAKLTYWLNL